MKKWIKISLIIALFVAVSIGAYFILKSLGVTSIDKLQELIASCGAWGWIVFTLLFISYISHEGRLLIRVVAKPIV